MVTKQTARTAYTGSFLAGMKPQSIKQTVSEWSDEHRILSSKSSSEPGFYRTSRTPYMREIMDNLGPQSKCKRIVFMKSSQVGATEVANNWLSYIIDLTPGPVMMVYPTDKLASRTARQRIEHLISGTPQIADKVAKYKGKNDSNTKDLKDFTGGFFMLVGANSPANFRSTPVRFVVADEIDAFPEDCGGEGDPIELLEGRTKTFERNKKIYYVSTPVDEESSLINKLYERSNKKKYYVPCPECGHMQVLQFQNLKWDKGNYETVHYKCQGCEAKLQEKHKTIMLQNGEWIPENPESSYAEGYHISALYSPVGWESWASIAERWDKIRMRKDPTALKAFVNTVLGEPWKDRSDAPEWEMLYRQREIYQTNTIPDNAPVLTAGIDVQRDRVEMEIVAWGKNLESYSVDYRVYKGDTSQDKIWTGLKSILNETFQNKDGSIRKQIDQIAIDSSDNTQRVYNWVHEVASDRVMAVKGMDSGLMMVSQPKRADIKFNNRVIYRGCQLWTVNVSMIKDELYRFLKQKPPLKPSEPFPFGFCHFPEYDEEYFKQLTAENKEKIVRGGRVSYQWKKTRDRNEALDCRVYARAAAFVLNIDNMSKDDWQGYDQELKQEKQTQDIIQEVSEQKQPTNVKRRQSDFW